MKEFFTILITVILALVIAVSLQPVDLSPLDDITLALEENGFAVIKEKPETEHAFLHGERYRLILNENPETNVTVYVYKNVNEAQKEADYINNDGFGIDYVDGFGLGQSVQISWVGVAIQHLGS